MSVEISECLQKEIDWLAMSFYTYEAIIEKDTDWMFSSVHETHLEDFENADSPYAQFVVQNKLTRHERFVLILSLLPYIAPHELTPFSIQGNQYRLLRSSIEGAYFPTQETALRILSDNVDWKKLLYLNLFEPDNILFRKGILELVDFEITTKVLRVNKTFLKTLGVQLYESIPFNKKFPKFDVNLSKYLEYKKSRLIEVELFNPIEFVNNEGEYCGYYPEGILLKGDDLTIQKIPFRDIFRIHVLTK